ncbi:MAG: M14 family metallopeptidase [Caulobacter sp.]|nr:M14 family metallopeptidase [Caulobacter sp.]
MKKLILTAALVLTATAAAAAPWESDFLPPAIPWHGKSEKLIVKADDPWITPSEVTGLTATPSYDETIAWLKTLDAASPLIRMEVFGRTPEGRDLYVVIASKDQDRFDPSKPLMLAQAGIHSGEIDGKDAGLMLLRDIALKGKDGLLDRVNFVFVPVFSADAHERTSPWNRPNQRGPVSQGWRTTAQNLNLNRDYGKLDAPEMRAMVGLINRFDPSLYFDLHVTDGIDYQYDVTFGFEGEDGGLTRSPAIAAWLNSALKPAAYAALTKAGHIPGPLIFAVDDRAPRTGLFVGPTGLRLSNGYGDARHTPTILVENHSLKPYRQRVLGMYVLMEAALKALAADEAGVRAAIASDRARRPTQVLTGWKVSTTPIGTRAFLGVQYETYRSAASGRDEIRWLGKADKTPWPQPLFSSTATLTFTPPAAYWVPASKPDVIARLRLHGIGMDTLTAPKTVTLSMARLSAPKLAARANEGRVGIDPGPVVWETRTVTLPAGSVRVSTDQPLGELAVLLLEPQSDEGFFAWGFFPEILQRTEYIEGYAIAPLAQRMLDADPQLKAAFEAKLAAEPAFASDPDARLAWFYARTPYFDDHYLLYPAGREPAA